MNGLLVGLSLALGAPAPKEKETPTIVGQWAVESRVLGGKPIDGETPYTTVELTADGRFLYLKGTEVVGSHAYKADPTKTPAEFDVTVAGGQTQAAGIFKVEKGTLVLCLDRAGTRPTKFESPAGTQVEIWTFKRVPKKD
jgi:uncharacterized protein (TIGR03067 family)